MSRRLRLLVALLTAAALASPTSSSGAPAPDRDHRAERAERALANVERIFDGTRSRPVDDVTPALLELRSLHRHLGRADRRRAESLLSRPTDNVADAFPGDKYGPQADVQQQCSAVVCIHYATTTADAADPAIVSAATGAAALVHSTYVTSGYRAPKPDGSAGGGPQTDLYLVDLAGVHYGYCVPEEFETRSFSYCVLDNDYAASEYGTSKTPLENLKVTLAHEYFHAVQFNYDSFEGWRGSSGPWFMEATATWAEDEVFDDINDNVQFLSRSPITHPHVPLTTYETQGSFQYGTWIWLRFLTERWRAAQGAMPVLVRDAWRRAAAPDDNALSALKRTIAVNGADFDRVLALFGAGNRRSRAHYDEGAGQRYPVAPLARSVRVGSRAVGGTAPALALSSRTLRTVPRSALWSERWRVRVKLTSKRPGVTEGLAAIHWRRGGVGYRRIALGSSGVGVRELPFGRARVRFVELTLTNASTGARFDIGYRFTPYQRRGR